MFEKKNVGIRLWLRRGTFNFNICKGTFNINICKQVYQKTWTLVSQFVKLTNLCHEIVNAGMFISLKMVLRTFTDSVWIIVYFFFYFVDTLKLVSQKKKSSSLLMRMESAVGTQYPTMFDIYPKKLKDLKCTSFF